MRFSQPKEVNCMKKKIEVRKLESIKTSAATAPVLVTCGAEV
jgi:hypothetical protein